MQPSVAAMLFCSYLPRPPLDAFITDLWLYEDYAGSQPHERILPTGTFELVLNLREDELRIYGDAGSGDFRRFEGAVISGAYARPFMSDAAEEIALLGVHFKPGGATAVLGMNARELANAHVDLSDVWGRSGRLLREQLCTLTNPLARFRLVEQVLLKRALRQRAGHPAVRAGLALLVDTAGRVQVDDAARSVGLTQRRFTELFSAEVGVTPKLFARIQRFQHAVALSDGQTSVDWSRLAATCGYFDQSHLVRDFRQFSLATPAEFHLERRELAAAGQHVKRHHFPVGR